MQHLMYTENTLYSKFTVNSITNFIHLTGKQVQQIEERTFGMKENIFTIYIVKIQHYKELKQLNCKWTMYSMKQWVKQD
jgi:hypothetical protein